MVITTLIVFIAFLFSSVSDEQSREVQHYGSETEGGTFHIYDDLSESCKKIPLTEKAVDSLLILSDEMRNRNSSQSFRAARQAVAIAEQINYKRGLAAGSNLMGIKYLDFGDHEMAHSHYLNSMRIEQELENREGIASLLNNISLIYVEQEEYETAASYLKRSIDAWKEIDGEYESLLGTNNLGVIYRRSGDYDKALDMFWKTSKRALLQDEPDSLAHIVATLNIGNTYRNMGKLNRARIHLHTALDYLEKNGLTSHIIFTNIVLGKLYKELRQTNKAFLYAEKALQLASEQSMSNMRKDSHKLLAEIYEQNENFKPANEHLHLYYTLADSLEKMQRGENIEKLQTRFEVEQKEREIDILNKEAELREANLARMNQFRSFLIASVLLLFAIIGLLYRANLNKQRNNQILELKQKEIGEKNDSLQKLNEEKDEFMSIAAHDLRNPLSSVKMAVDLINSDEKIDRATLTEYTELIQISANRMITLINDVLQIHTIDVSSGDAFSEIQINDLVKESLQHFKKPAASKNIRLKTVLNENLNTFVGDSDNLLRIFDNLISNAIKYSPENTTVFISTRQILNKLQITIRDQGPGIKPEDRQKMFGKFSRLSNRPTGNESSTGLGLYIVKKICNAMGGDVRCESEPDCGASFIVELPVEESVKTPETSLRSRPKKRRVVG